MEEQKNDNLENLVAMGFNREEAINALKIAKNDFDLACEYCL